MTPRRWASIVLRTLLLLGGAGVLLVLGASAAGASESPARADADRLLHHAPATATRPDPVTVAVPPPLVPGPAGTTLPTASVALPGITTTAGGPGVTVGIDPAGVPAPLGDVPVLPVPGLDPPAPPPTAAPARLDPHGPDPRGGDAASHASARYPHGDVTRVDAAPAPSTRAPGDPLVPPATSIALLLGAAAGAAPSARRFGAPDAGILDAVRARRDRLPIGPARAVVPGGAPPGFALLLARPG